MTASRRQSFVIASVIIVLALLWYGFVATMRKQVELHILTTGPNGTQTPAMFGATWQHLAIPSGPRQLDASLVQAICVKPAILLMYHGMGETLSDWAHAQQFLATRCVTSLVFDPTGDGNSPRPTSMSFVGDDAIAAYEFTRRLFPGQPVAVLGHSLGNALMLPAIPHFSVPPAAVIEANGFTNLRAVAGRRKSTAFRAFLALMPDYWDNVQAV